MLRHLLRKQLHFSSRCFFFINPSTVTTTATTPQPPSMEEPKGTVIFSTVGLPNYGFDVYSFNVSTHHERRLTDGISINFNAQFTNQTESKSIVFISERAGSPRIYLTQSDQTKPEPLPFVPDSFFHDRPILLNNTLFFISAHENPVQCFKSWSALYSIEIDHPGRVTRLTPPGFIDYSPSISRSGKFVAVASYGSRTWEGEFHELNTDIVVFKRSDPKTRSVVCERGGWPTWHGDSVIYFHRQAEDGWWSIFMINFPENLESAGFPVEPVRITPPGVHCFTPSAFHGSDRIAVATRRKDKNYRHVEIFDVGLEKFDPVTELVNPNLHHYSPFVSSDSSYVGYHRFRGESSRGELTIPHLDPVASPIKDLRMLRLNGYFPVFSPDGTYVALNRDFDANRGLKVIRSNGSKRWTLITNRNAFYNSWSPTEKGVIYTSVGPIFESPKTPVQIARVEFDLSSLTVDKEEIQCKVKILTKEETGNNAFPSCSPDGKSIVFRSGRAGHKNLYIIDAINGEFDGGYIRKLTEGPCIDTMPSWSPSGDLIAFSSNRHNPDDVQAFSIYVIKPDGTGLRRIYVAGSEGSSEVNRERINHVCFSSDAKWLLFTANLGGVTAEPISLPNQFQPYGELYMAKLDGSGLRRLTWNGYEDGVPAWHPGCDLDFDRLSLVNAADADRLKGQFDEPLWISCDI